MWFLYTSYSDKTMKTHYATVLDNINFEQFYYDMISAPLIALAAWGKIFMSKTSRWQ